MPNPEPSGAERASQDRSGISRRALLGMAGGVGLVAVASGIARTLMWEHLRWGEDFFPGTPPTIRLEPNAWTTTDDTITFAVLGDHGSGGRNQMDVARQMARTYQRTPYGLVVLAGDISYYGSIEDRWHDVFVEPYRPLNDAGVEWELAVGNHELSEQGVGDEAAAAELQAQLRRFGKPNTYYVARHGPVDFIQLDSVIPVALGTSGREQLDWLEQTLAESTARWKVVTVHRPPYSSGSHGSDLTVREAIEPILVEGGVDIVFAGHDHHYERTHPQHGIVHVVSGAGCMVTRVGESDLTAFATSELQFMLVRVDGDLMDVRCLGTDGQVIDRVELRKGVST